MVWACVFFFFLLSQKSRTSISHVCLLQRDSWPSQEMFFWTSCTFPFPLFSLTKPFPSNLSWYCRNKTCINSFFKNQYRLPLNCVTKLNSNISNKCYMFAAMNSKNFIHTGAKVVKLCVFFKVSLHCRS